MENEEEQFPIMVDNKATFIDRDEIDEKLCQALSKNNLNLPVKRVSADKLLFGTKQVEVKYVNDNLTILEGKSEKSLSEFIDEHGKNEWLKVNQKEAK